MDHREEDGIRTAAEADAGAGADAGADADAADEGPSSPPRSSPRDGRGGEGEATGRREEGWEEEEGRGRAGEDFAAMVLSLPTMSECEYIR